MTTTILVLASNPVGTEPLQLNPEIRAIRESHERSLLNNIKTMNNPTIETDIAEILKEIQVDQKVIISEVNNLQKQLTAEINDLQKQLTAEVNNLKLGQATIEGNIKALDTKVEQLDKRVGNSEFTNRGILIGLVVVILGGAAKLFGWMPNP